MTPGKQVRLRTKRRSFAALRRTTFWIDGRQPDGLTDPADVASRPKNRSFSPLRMTNIKLVMKWFDQDDNLLTDTMFLSVTMLAVVAVSLFHVLAWCRIRLLDRTGSFASVRRSSQSNLLCALILIRRLVANLAIS
jgi:hypothetical protein